MRSEMSLPNRAQRLRSMRASGALTAAVGPACQESARRKPRFTSGDEWTAAIGPAVNTHRWAGTTNRATDCTPAARRQVRQKQVPLESTGPETRWRTAPRGQPPSRSQMGSRRAAPVRVGARHPAAAGGSSLTFGRTATACGSERNDDNSKRDARRRGPLPRTLRQFNLRDMHRHEVMYLESETTCQRQTPSLSGSLRGTGATILRPSDARTSDRTRSR